MYSNQDKERRFEEQPSSLEKESYRACWRRDYARLIHCPSFRRLQGKTQLYPGNESDFFRNRLTHSLEVGQIAKSIAIQINSKYLKKREDYIDSKGKPVKGFLLSPTLVEFAGLAHDLGHPPFGHIGEEALDECMLPFGGFEGNAQTLRILSKIEKKLYFEDAPLGISEEGQDKRVGLNLMYRSLAAILKYDNIIPFSKEERKALVIVSGEDKPHPVKGYYKIEEDLVKLIKEKVTGMPDFVGKFKTIECQIMDIADDIAYSVYDLEDTLKAGFLNPYDLVFADKTLIDKVTEEVVKKAGINIDNIEVFGILVETFNNIFSREELLPKDELKPDTTENPENETEEVGDESSQVSFANNFLATLIYNYPFSKEVASNGYLRTMLTSKLIGKFIRGVEFKYDERIPALSKVELNDSIRRQVEVLKRFTYLSQIMSPRIKMTEYRGKEIVKKIFKVLKAPEGYKLLPKDYQDLYLAVNSEADKMRTICDFIAGMTNNYAIEFYGRLTSEIPATIFKPY